MQFTELNLIEPLLRAVRAEGYETPTPIQRQAIPHVLAGRDLVGCAQTGTGKTAAFALPILQRLFETKAPARRERGGGFRALILSPTRELASQIKESFDIYGRNVGLRSLVIFGGVGQSPQVDAVRRGADILVATPGRLLDLMSQGEIRLNTIEIFVLDEADRMLDMGFIHDVRRVINGLPTRRQTLLFSATMPADIQELADRILIDPVRVEVTPQATTVERIAQSVYFVEKNDKPALLEHLLRDSSIRRVLVFTRTKHGADRVAKRLESARISAAAIHGNKSQGARERALADFKSGRTRVLVATDIAARGIDVEDVTHVINFDLPNIPESYVHRIGRTARAGADGIAYSFCDEEEREYLADIEKTIRLRVPVVESHPYPSPLGLPSANPLNGRANGGQNRNGQHNGRSGQSNNSRNSSNGARSSNGSAARPANGGGNSVGRPASGSANGGNGGRPNPSANPAQRPQSPVAQAEGADPDAPPKRRRRRGGRGRNRTGQGAAAQREPS